MSDSIIVALIVASGPMLVGLFGLVHQVVESRVAKAEREEARRDRQTLKNNVEIIEKATNSMKDALVAAARKEGKAEGHSEGRAEGILTEQASQAKT